MSNASSPTCVLCDAPPKWYCVTCGGKAYCHDHACNHLARQYPDDFNIKSGPVEQQRQDNQRTTRFLIIAAIGVILFLLLMWMWSQPSNGNSETRLCQPTVLFVAKA